uniref:Uncharacterized protein n=1 Tax=Meloidogyne enterolobii TaxID=390850 RepID=A0A6V7UHC0_MELEN|nr:unnamed protein product [Meloidogyne enterolobii]
MNRYNLQVTGYLQDVKFLEVNDKKCLKVKEYVLPSNIAKTDKGLVEGDQIIIKGQVPNPFNETTITVCLMHRALEVTEHIGENIYILYIYSNYSDNTAFVVSILFEFISRGSKSITRLAHGCGYGYK